MGFVLLLMLMCVWLLIRICDGVDCVCWWCCCGVFLLEICDEIVVLKDNGWEWVIVLKCLLCVYWCWMWVGVYVCWLWRCVWMIVWKWGVKCGVGGDDERNGGIAGGDGVKGEGGKGIDDEILVFVDCGEW